MAASRSLAAMKVRAVLAFLLIGATIAVAGALMAQDNDSSDTPEPPESTGTPVNGGQADSADSPADPDDGGTASSAPSQSTVEHTSDKHVYANAVNDHRPVVLETRTEAKEAAKTWMETVDAFFDNYLVTPLAKALFFDFGTSYLFRVEGSWAFSDQDIQVSGTISRKNNGLYINSKRIEERDGKKEQVEQRYYAPTAQSLEELLPEGFAIYQQYAVDSNRSSTSIPFVVVWLFLGAVFFTLRMGFINVRGFWHALRVTMGAYDKPGETGEVSHFQALASALSATVGLGNIAGVAIAIGVGGPGATFWMIVVGLLGMTTKFTECSLGQIYRKVLPDGTVLGGPMQYLKAGLTEMRLGPLGTVLATLFALLCIGASFGGGNAFQVGQSLDAIRGEIPMLAADQYPWVYGLVMAVMAGLVIIGGIRSIGAVAGKIVPFMCGAYVIAALYILFVNAGKIPESLGLIVSSAFSYEAGLGGFLGVLVQGVRRAVFSNEAGAGSAAIAHSAAKTDEPISEGVVALLEPFIDTVVVCTMTALVIIITGVYADPQYEPLISGDKGASLTAEAFKTGGYEWFKWILYAAVVLFAYSTLISWSYYGERCWTALFGLRASMAYRIIFLIFTVLGSIVTAGNILAFSDLLILGMAFPNVLGLFLLSGKVKRALDEYWGKYKRGELDVEAKGPPGK